MRSYFSTFLFFNIDKNQFVIQYTIATLNSLQNKQEGRSNYKDLFVYDQGWNSIRMGGLLVIHYGFFHLLLVAFN